MSIVDRVLREQKDLTALTSVKAGFQTSEVYKPNDNYGMAFTLKRYSGYPKHSAVRAIIPHGIYAPAPVFRGELETSIRSVLCWQPHLDPFYAQAGMNVVPMAAPFLYAMRITELPKNLPKPTGTLFFPAHSTAGIESVFDWEQLADEVSRLPHQFQPVTVCAYWHDYAAGRFGPFEKRGMKTVSCGHLNDRDFLVRLTVLLKLHRFAASNEVGSTIFYSVAAGTPFFLIGEGTTAEAKVPVFKSAMKGSSEATQHHERTRALFYGPTEEISAEQRTFVDEHMRPECLLKPTELRKTLESLPYPH